MLRDNSPVLGHPFPRQMFYYHTLRDLSERLLESIKYKSSEEWLDLLLKLLWEGETDKKFIGTEYSDTVGDYKKQSNLPQIDKHHNTDIPPMPFTRLFVACQLVQLNDAPDFLKNALLDEKGCLKKRGFSKIDFLGIFEKLHKMDVSHYGTESIDFIRKRLELDPEASAVLEEAAKEAFSTFLKQSQTTEEDKHMLPQQVGRVEKPATTFMRKLHMERLQNKQALPRNEAKFLLEVARKKITDLPCVDHVRNVIRKNKVLLKKENRNK